MDEASPEAIGFWKKVRETASIARAREAEHKQALDEYFAEAIVTGVCGPDFPHPINPTYTDQITETVIRYILTGETPEDRREEK